MFVFIYPISPLATAWPCIRLTLAPGVCNVCVCVKVCAPLPHLRHHFRGVCALLGRLRRILTGVANCFVKEIGRLASTRPAGVLCILPSVKPTLLPIRPLDPDSFLPKWIPHPFCQSLGCQQSGVADGTDTELAPEDPTTTTTSPPTHTRECTSTQAHIL